MLAFLLVSLPLRPSAEGAEKSLKTTALEEPAIPKHLADISRPVLDLQMGQRVGDLFTLVIGSDREQVPTRQGCKLAVPATTATFNGVNLVRIRGIYRGGDLAYDHDCMIEFGFAPLLIDSKQSIGERPSILGGPVPNAALTEGCAVVRLRDETASWTWEIPDAYSARKIAIVSPADGRLVRGKEVVLRWSPESDSLGELSTAELQGHEGLRQSLPVQAHNRDLRISLPLDLPSTFNGPVVIRIHADLTPSAGHCPVFRCSFALWENTEASTTAVVKRQS